MKDHLQGRTTRVGSNHGSPAVRGINPAPRGWAWRASTARPGRLATWHRSSVWREQTRTGALGSRLVQHCKPLFPVDSLVGRPNPWTTAYEARAYVSRMATAQNADRGKNPRRIRKSGGGNIPPIESISGGARAEAENLSLGPRPANKPGQHVAMLLQWESIPPPRLSSRRHLNRIWVSVLFFASSNSAPVIG